MVRPYDDVVGTVLAAGRVWLRSDVLAYFRSFMCFTDFFLLKTIITITCGSGHITSPFLVPWTIVILYLG